MYFFYKLAIHFLFLCTFLWFPISIFISIKALKEGDADSCFNALDSLFSVVDIAIYLLLFITALKALIDVLIL
ncbi:hypothetical protein CY0110_27460 [Crocosphaera chwakensis CCY0110]|uniref:Uncharacterized protein n=1 Tax=Crocosphaera chwakensis CCY0110 TaxID=391612 RepID=A3IR32_9CHRO|nr:hypothetical protein CY0110_27460 [Crocosphaera chwakensis CCY0110]